MTELSQQEIKLLQEIFIQPSHAMKKETAEMTQEGTCNGHCNGTCGAFI